MASPQLENGYFKIANEIAEKLCSHRLPGQENQIIWAILRKTYGFNKKEDEISYGQLSKITKINRPKVIKLVKSLVSKKILGSIQNGTRQPSTIWFNKDYDRWAPSPQKDTSPQKGTNLVPKRIPLPSPHMGVPQKTKRKDIIQKTGYPSWLGLDLWKDFRKMRVAIKKPMTERAETERIKSLKILIDQGYKQEDLLNQSIACCWQDFFPIKKTDSQNESNDDHRMICKKCNKKSDNIISRLCKKCREN